VLLLLTINTSTSQTASDEEQLKRLVQNSFDLVFSEMDTKYISDYFTGDFMLFENGKVWDMTKLRTMLNSDSMKGIDRINDFEFIQITINDNTAWLAYHNKATFRNGDEIINEMNWLESATAVRTKDGWRMDMLHSTRKPEID